MFTSNALVVTTVFTLLSPALVHATLLSRQSVVVAPKILKPDASSVWQVGSVQTITWDTDNLYVPPPYKIANPNAQILLGFIGDGNGLHLDINHPIAKGFKLLDGSVQLTVPNVPLRDDYLVVLFGTAGNKSPSFSVIANPSGANSTSGAPMTVTPTSTSASSIQPSTSQQSTSSTDSSNSISSSSTSITSGSSSATTSGTATDPSVAQTQPAFASDTPTSPVPTPTPANIGAGNSNHGSLTENMVLLSMVSMLALVVF